MPDSSTAPEATPASTFEVMVRSDAQCVRLTVDVETSIRLALDSTELRVRAACGGLGTCGACLIQLIEGDCNPPTLAERQKIPPEELADGVRLACQLKARSDCELYLQYPAPPSDWKSLAPHTLYQANPNPDISEHVYAVAVDLGTTHLRVSLWNRQSGRRLGTRQGLNPQVADGADVLTRLDAERLETHTQRSLGECVRAAIMHGIRDILSRDFGEITPILMALGRVMIVGNTAMLTLVCGNSSAPLYDPDNWQTPIACLPDDLDHWRASWHTPHARIDVIQPLAGFIGSDLLASVLATEMTESPSPALLLDFGTNTEIALWDGERLWVTSVPGGPAFEGVGMRNGMTADSGAIYSVRHENEHWSLKTLSGMTARGFCASGFIDAVAALLEAGLLKPSGRFSTPEARHGYALDADNPRTAIFASDIDLFQRAKASTSAAVSQLMVSAGIQCSDLDKLWICGSFGQQLNIHSAFRVGLLPIIDVDRIRLLGNASLAGCERLLLATDGETQLDNLITSARAVNFGGAIDYESRFIDHLRLDYFHRH